MLGNNIALYKSFEYRSPALVGILTTVIATCSLPALSAETTGSPASAKSDTASQQHLDKSAAENADTTAGATSVPLKTPAAQQPLAPSAPAKTPPAQPTATSAESVPAPATTTQPAAAQPAQGDQSASDTTKAAASVQSATAVQTPGRNPRVIWKPGLELSAGTDAEDLVPTDDVELARKQVAAYPDNPEAGFILAVALTRTSHVEEALQEVRRARKLAEAKGGPAYFDKMIASYEEMVKHHPKENRVRYGLAWAYYMKAYMLAKASRRAAKVGAAQTGAPPAAAAPEAKKQNVWELAAAAANGKMPVNPPHIEGALAKADPAAHPQIKKYYELALGKLNELLAQKPDDVWARVYRAFLKAEYTGNLEESMQEWQACQAQAPNNPAPYFFLGEAYLKQGNLKECVNNISKAIALRAIGN